MGWGYEKFVKRTIAALEQELEDVEADIRCLEAQLASTPYEKQALRDRIRKKLRKRRERVEELSRQILAWRKSAKDPHDDDTETD